MSKYQIGEKLFYRSNHTHEYLPVEVTVVFGNIDNHYQVKGVTSNEEIDYKFITEEKYLSKTIIGTIDCDSNELPKTDFIPTLAIPIKPYFNETKNKEELKQQDIEGGAIRYNKGKLRYDLVPVSAIKALAEVLTKGSQKYPDENWRKGMKFKTAYASAMRHLMSWYSGEDLDKESNLNHLKHCLMNIAMLIEFIETNPELDDRVFKNKGYLC